MKHHSTPAVCAKRGTFVYVSLVKYSCVRQISKHTHTVEPVISPVSSGSVASLSSPLSPRRPGECRLSLSGTLCLQLCFATRPFGALQIIAKLCSCHSCAQELLGSQDVREGLRGGNGEAQSSTCPRSLDKSSQRFILQLIVKGFERGHPSGINRPTGESGAVVKHNK